MSYLRDLQKLRQNKTPYQQSFSHRFSQPQNHPDIYNVNFDKPFEQESSKTHFGKFNETYNKFLNSKELSSKNRDKKIHKRGTSNGINVFEKK